MDYTPKTSKQIHKRIREAHWKKYDHRAAYIRRWLTPGRARDFIKHAPDEIHPGDRVVLYCRVSGYVQAKNQNLADQETNLRRKADHLGAIIVGIHSYAGPGWDASAIADVAALARRFGAKLFAETTDRFARNPIYHSSNHPNLQARDCDLREMQEWTAGITLVTDLHPDAAPPEVRSYQRKRGQAMKGRCGGRPKIINDQRALLNAVVLLMRKLPHERVVGVRRKRRNKKHVSSRKTKALRCRRLSSVKR